MVSGIAKIVERSRLVVPTLSSKLDFCTSPSHLCNLNSAISLKAARDVKIQNGYLQTLTSKHFLKSRGIVLAAVRHCVLKFVTSYNICASKDFKGYLLNWVVLFCHVQHGKCSNCTQHNPASEGAD